MEIACFAHLRRKFFDLYEALNSPVAQEALERIRLLYEIETAIREDPRFNYLAERIELGSISREFGGYTAHHFSQSLVNALKHRVSRYSAKS